MLSRMVEYSSEQDPNRNIFGREARGIRTLRGVFYADCFGFIVSPSLRPTPPFRLGKAAPSVALMLNLCKIADVGKTPRRGRTNAAPAYDGCIGSGRWLCSYSRELHGRSQSLAGVSVEDRENVILFATGLEAVREDYVDREATDPEKLT